MRFVQAIGLVLLAVGARGVGYEEGHREYEAVKAIAQDNKRTGELALKALDKAWLTCADPVNQPNWDDDRLREIHFRR